MLLPLFDQVNFFPPEALGDTYVFARLLRITLDSHTLPHRARGFWRGERCSFAFVGVGGGRGLCLVDSYFGGF